METQKKPKFTLPGKKALLLSFLLPFFIVGALYHFVYVCDAQGRSQGLDQKYPNMPVEKAVEMEESSRWTDPRAWLLHLLIFGTPSGLIVLGLVCGIKGLSGYLSANKG